MAKKPKPFPMKPAPELAGLKCREPGVYADWPAREYHADEALSFSRERKLAIGPMAFWHSSPWNPNKVLDEDSTAAQIKGNAYHKRILEGSAAFAAAYAVPPTAADYPNALDGQRALAAELEANGLKKSGSVGELVARIKENKLPVQLMADVMAEWEKEHGKKQKLKPELLREVEFAASICEQHPDISPLFKRGRPEVSVCYITRAGVPMRMRMDWTAPGLIVDLKTMANSTGQPFPVAVARTITSEFYHVQARIAAEAYEAALQMPDECWHGFTPEEIAEYRAAPEPQFRFLFVGSPAPEICQRILGPEVPIDYAHFPDGTPVVGGPATEPSSLWRSAENIHEQMQARFYYFWKLYGRKPWFDAAPAIGLRDSSPGIFSGSLTRENELEG